MRNLSRIIFINSANIPYSDDIYLDGNVHFIGTQGVGKSTLLRAILFFYNADTQRLGISVEKQNYTDYYFPYSLRADEVNVSVQINIVRIRDIRTIDKDYSTQVSHLRFHRKC